MDKLDRRRFLATTAAATAANMTLDNPITHALAAGDTLSDRLDPLRHRFGVNYTPSHNWWFCWNDWNPDPIKRDLDAIAALGADHLRILLIWPFFQPNPTWVSPAHLERLDQLVALMGERHLDALVTVFTGQLSGWYFLPPFHRQSDLFFTDPMTLAAQELLVRELSRTLAPHENVIGFDLGNEINTCWTAKTEVGDAWMKRMFALMNETLPARSACERRRPLAVVQQHDVFAAGIGCGSADAGDALLSLLDRRGEVRRSHGPAQRETPGGDGSAHSVVCRDATEAGMGRRIQYVHQGAERRAAGGVAGEGGARGYRAGRELVQLLG